MVVPTATERFSSVKPSIGEFTKFAVAGVSVGVGGTGVGGRRVGGMGVGGAGTGVAVATLGNAVPSPVAVMVAVMNGCIVHQYGNSPGSSKVKLKASARVHGWAVPNAILVRRNAGR